MHVHTHHKETSVVKKRKWVFSKTQQCKPNKYMKYKVNISTLSFGPFLLCCALWEAEPKTHNQKENVTVARIR